MAEAKMQIHEAEDKLPVMQSVALSRSNQTTVPWMMEALALMLLLCISANCFAKYQRQQER